MGRLQDNILYLKSALSSYNYIQLKNNMKTNYLKFILVNIKLKSKQKNTNLNMLLLKMSMAADLMCAKGFLRGFAASFIIKSISFIQIHDL